MARQEHKIFLELGSNLGDRAGFLNQACGMIHAEIGPILQRSSVYETEPWEMEDAGPFLNQAIRVSSSLSPHQLLRVLQEIEQNLGRFRVPRLSCYVSRIIDIDILFYGKEIVATPALTIPHPHIAERRFVLVSLAEIAGRFRDPVSGKPVKRLLEECRDHREVRLWGTE